MSLFDRMRTQKVLSFTLILFTLSVGIVIGTVVNQGVKAAKDDRPAAAPGATPLVIPDPGATDQFVQPDRQDRWSRAWSISRPPTCPKRRPGAATTRPPPSPSRSSPMTTRAATIPTIFSTASSAAIPSAAPDGGRGRKSYALGSGVVVDKAGYILTNNHVVDKADRIQVKFNGDPTEYEAKVIGVDAPTDLAVIRVEGKTDLVPAKIGNSDAVQVGDWSVAIGSPFGYQATVTAGIISAKSRDIDPDHAVPAFPADRRRHQPRQQRRPAAQHPRRSDRHQHRHRVALRRLPGHRLRAADQHGREGL